MLKMLFFFMGVPLMIMSFFETIDVLPYATDFNVMVGGKEIEISMEQKADLQEQIKEGYYISIKFDQTYCVNELPFDELVFEVQKDFSGFNLLRGNKGVFQGRCIYMSIVDGNMDELFNLVKDIAGEVKVEIEQPSESPVEAVKEEKISD